MEARANHDLAFGPVPSRRLGFSLGINNIPAKTCTYSCVYCQVGPETSYRIQPGEIFSPQSIVRAVREKLKAVQGQGGEIDFLTFVPDGEPTLDEGLARTIELLRPLDIPVAIITNGSLMTNPRVRQGAAMADWVSLKVDSVHSRTWRRINRPHRKLNLASILKGMLDFSRIHRGTLVTETMLVRDINDDASCLEAVAGFLRELSPSKSYLSVPTRPPAVKWARCPGEAALHLAYQIFQKSVDNVEYLIGYEGNAFASTGDVEKDLLSITAVHPMRRDAVEALLAKAGEDWSAVRSLIDEGRLREMAYEGHKFFMRALYTPPSPGE